MQPNPFERLKPDEGPVRHPDKVVAGDVNMGAVDRSGNDGTTPPSSFGWKRIVGPALSVTTSFQIGSPRGRDSASDDRRLFEPRADQSQVRAWEDDLQSRRSSKDIFSIFKRKRVNVARDG
jgi:hypothetical protein